MAETQRTIADLLSRLPDNITGDISPEDVRDIVATLASDHAEISLSSPSTTAVAVAGTYYKCAGTTVLTAIPAAHNFTMPVDNRMQYAGTAERIVHVTCNFSMSVLGNNKLMKFRLARNGVTVPESEIQRWVSTGTDIGAASCQTLCAATVGDYVELWGANATDTTDFRIEIFQMVAVGHAT
jgi:hypothetical protein